MSEAWIKEHNSITRIIQSVSQTFNERSKYPKSSSNFIKLSNLIRSQITKLNSNVNTLERHLEESTLTYLERNRRVKMLNELRLNIKQFEQALEDDSGNQKSVLIDMNDNNGRSSIETETTMSYNTNQLLAQHDQILQEQDRGLETLSHIVQNQKRIATAIGNEVDKQNVMIENMGDNMDQLNDRLVNETKRVKIFSTKTGTCGIWFIIILLLIAIIVIAALPKH